MNWKEINEWDLPKKEVLAANFTPGTLHYKDKLLGHLVFVQGRVQCDNHSAGQMIDCCTHYIDVESIELPAKPKPKQNQKVQFSEYSWEKELNKQMWGIIFLLALIILGSFCLLFFNLLLTSRYISV